MPRKKAEEETEKEEKAVEESTQESVEKTVEKEKPKKAKEEKAKTEKVKTEEEDKDQTILTSVEDYIKTAAYLGTKVITPTMRKYIYRRRLDGLAILDTNIVDKKLKELIDFLVKYKPEDWIVVCKRNSGWRAAKMFSELTGVRVFTKKYPAGILTNTELPNFFETKMIFICDPWMDKNALNDAKKILIPVAGVCDTNNHTSNIDVVAIANNKSNKSLGLIFWLLAREYMKAHGMDKDKKLPSLEDFAGEKLILEEPRKKRDKKKLDDKASDEQLIESKLKELQRAEEGV